MIFMAKRLSLLLIVIGLPFLGNCAFAAGPKTNASTVLEENLRSKRQRGSPCSPSPTLSRSISSLGSNVSDVAGAIKEQTVPSGKIHEMVENVSRYPHPIRSYLPHQEVTMGDLHGSALKMLYFLVKEGLVTMPEEDYRAFAESYRGLKGEAGSVAPILTPEQVEKVESLINKIEVKKGGPKIRLIGDETGDRGKNDLINLLLLHKVKQGQIAHGENDRLEIMVSNHGLEFMNYYERTLARSEDFRLRHLGVSSQAASVVGLVETVKKTPALMTKIQEIVEKTYKPSLRALAYSEDEMGFSLYSHAPVGLEAVEGLAGKFQIGNCTHEEIKTTSDLKGCIDSINKKIEPLIYGSLAESTASIKNFSQGRPMYETTNIQYVAWNDPYSNKNFYGKEVPTNTRERFTPPLMQMPLALSGVPVFYVHGHAGANLPVGDEITPKIGEQTLHDHDINIDNILEKAEGHPGFYGVWVGGKKPVEPRNQLRRSAVF